MRPPPLLLLRYHNVLCQAVGAKYVRLYDAADTGALYPRAGPLCNNSHLDVERMGEGAYAAAFPRFHAAPCWQTVLLEGEALYIPRHAWHYVRSLEVSFSASFWWGAKMGLVNRSGGLDGPYEAVY